MKDMKNIKNDKPLEYMGVFCAAVGFACLSMGFMLWGFGLGIMSCFCLIPYFALTKQNGLFILQVYFLIFNILGVINNAN